mgnify:CR=1 FL=1
MPADVDVDADLEMGGETLLDDDSSSGGSRRGSLNTEINRAQSGSRGDDARSERNGRQATSDDFDPRSTLHRDSTTLNDPEQNLGGDFDFEGQPELSEYDDGTATLRGLLVAQGDSSRRSFR